MTDKRQVLLVEDNELNRRLFSDLLTILDVGVTAVENGTEALRVFKERKFDLILTDIYLPDISGVELTHIIRSNTDGQKVVAVTAAPNIKAAEEFLSEFDARANPEFRFFTSITKLMTVYIYKMIEKIIICNLYVAQY